MFAGSMILNQGSRFALGLVLAAFLITADYATWGRVQLLVAYSTYAALGVGMGINRDLAILLGAGRHGEGTRRSSAALLVAITTSVLFVIGSMAWLRPGILMAAAFGTYILLTRLTLSGLGVLRAAQRFGAAARGLVLTGVFVLALVVPLVVVSRSLLFVLVLDAVLAVAFAYYLIAGRDLYSRSFGWPDVTAAVKSGLPLAAGAAAFTFRLTAVDLVALSRYGEDFFAGLFLAMIFLRILYFIPTITNMLWLPELARSFGSSGKAALRRMTLRLARTYVIWLALGVLVLAATSYGGCRVAFQPTCSDPGLVVLRVISGGVTFLPLVLAMFLSVTRRMRVVIVANVAGLLPYAVVAIMSRPGKGVLALSMVLSALVYVLVVVAGFYRSSSDATPEGPDPSGALEDQTGQEGGVPT